MRLVLTLLLVPSFGAHAQVYRCGNNYSTAPCPGAKAIDVTPRGSVVEGAGPARKIFLCKSYSGQQFWSSNNCYHRGGSTLVREVSVPRHMGWDDQVTTAQRAHREAESLKRPPGGVQSTSTPRTRRAVVTAFGRRLRAVKPLRVQAARGDGWIILLPSGTG